MTLPEQLRKWATSRERLRLDGKLLRRAADTIEHDRATIKLQYALRANAKRANRLEVLRDLRTFTEAGVELDTAAIDELIRECEQATTPIEEVR